MKEPQKSEAFEAAYKEAEDFEKVSTQNTDKGEEQPEDDRINNQENPTPNQSGITNNKEIEIVISKDNGAVCINEEVQFITNHPCNCSYIWDFGDGELAYKKWVSHKYDAAATYPVKVTITDKETHEVKYASPEVVKVVDNPVTDILVEQPEWNNCEIDYNFVSSGTANQHIWKVNGNIVSNESNYAQPLLEKGEYRIELTTENIHGCTNTDTENIVIEDDYSLGAPTGYRLGIDEPWMPRDLRCAKGEFTLQIVRKDGTLAFESNSYDNKWNGFNNSLRIRDPVFVQASRSQSHSLVHTRRAGTRGFTLSELLLVMTIALKAFGPVKAMAESNDGFALRSLTRDMIASR